LLTLLVRGFLSWLAIGAMGDTIADQVLGQPDFIHFAINGVGAPPGQRFVSGALVTSVAFAENTRLRSK